MENGPFIDDFPMNTSIYKGFSMAMLNNQMVMSHTHCRNGHSEVDAPCWAVPSYVCHAQGWIWFILALHGCWDGPCSRHVPRSETLFDKPLIWFLDVSSTLCLFNSSPWTNHQFSYIGKPSINGPWLP